MSEGFGAFSLPRSSGTQIEKEKFLLPPFPPLAARLSADAAARVVLRVQPAVGGARRHGRLPGRVPARLPRGAAARRQHGRRQRQHGAALQRVPLQLRHRQEAPGRRYGAQGPEGLGGCYDLLWPLGGGAAELGGRHFDHVGLLERTMK